jgi:hypothetical protein
MVSNREVGGMFALYSELQLLHAGDEKISSLSTYLLPITK